MKILLLGSGGFVGQHVSSTLATIGYEIVRADIPHHTNTDYLIIDPINPDFEALLLHSGIDACINCTGAASVPESFKNPLHDFTLNTFRVAQMLEAIRKVSPNTKYINFSSAAVYGNPSSNDPITESSELKPLSPYGWHKCCAEDLCYEFSQLLGLKTISLRVFSAYGPNLRKQLFWDLYEKAVNQPKVELFGTGQETRDFIYVTDIANALHVILQAGEFDGRAINVASGTSSSIATVANALLDALHIKKEVVFSGNERIGDPINWHADISYLKKLGFSPQYDLEKGIAEVANWMKTL